MLGVDLNNVSLKYLFPQSFVFKEIRLKTDSKLRKVLFCSRGISRGHVFFQISILSLVSFLFDSDGVLVNCKLVRKHTRSVSERYKGI